MLATREFGRQKSLAKCSDFNDRSHAELGDFPIPKKRFIVIGSLQGSTRMYESFFGFVNRPFLPAPTLDRYYPAPAMEQTIHTANRAIARAEGPVAIFGGTGLGKTVCCLRIAEHFRRNFEVVMLASSHLVTRRALLQSLLFELRMPFRDLNEGELRLTLMNRLQPTPDLQSEGLLLIVDEAQTLSLKLLEEIRLLTNVMRNGLPRVRLVLCGSLKLEDNLCHPQMESLNQRIATRCFLTPLSMEETAQYVAHKLELSGVSHSSVITRDALDAIYRGSDGIPRLIDRLADQSLLLATQERQRPVSAALVGKAWGMLQQLPNPWSEPESIKTAAKSPAFVAQSTDLGQYSTISTSDSIPQSEPTSNIAAWFQSTSAPAAKQESRESIVEFGTLDEVSEDSPSKNATTAPGTAAYSMFNTEYSTPSLPAKDELQPYSVSRGPSAWERELDEYQLAPIGRAGANAPIAPNKSQSTKSDATSVFGSDFDEEFNLPVQSSNGYKSYSGIAFGNLNHDLQSIENEADNRFELEEAQDFLVPATSRAHETSSFDRETSISDLGESSFEPISNITPSQAANLERQVEEEMRELVSDLNMNAMTFDPMQRIVDTPSQPSSVLLDRFGERDVLSFADMNDQWEPSERKNRRPVPTSNVGDDRDMLVVEEDLETIRNTMDGATKAPHRPILHPYAKLFSNLRNS
jgi:general secretion pathway protein A